jgi:hypothetical protein
MTTQVVEYSVTDAAIEEMKAQFMQLEVTLAVNIETIAEGM